MKGHFFVAVNIDLNQLYFSVPTDSAELTLWHWNYMPSVICNRLDLKWGTCIRVAIIGSW